MGAWQHAVADFDRAHGAGVTTVDARLAGQNLATNNAGFDVKQHALDLDAVKGKAVGLQVSHDHGIGFTAGVGTGLLIANLISRAQALFCQRIHAGNQRLVLGGGRPVPNRLAGIAHQIVDGVDGNVALLMAKHHGAEHDLFAELLGFRLHHQHCGFGTSHDQVHDGALACGLTRVEHVLAVDIANTSGTNRAGEWNTADRQGSTGGDQSGDVCIDFRVQRQGMHHDLNFIKEAFGEERANRAVDQTAGECFKLAGATFAFEKAARNLAGSVGFFQIIHRQGEEILTGLGVLGRHHRRQHHCAFDIHHHSTTRLAGDLSGFHDDRVLAPLEGLGHFIEHAHIDIS